jgi:uncharacterized protein YndB with AHSA1/START domain
VRFTRRYPVSRTELWSAITEPDRTARWAFRTELEPHAGGALRFDLGEAGVSEGTVLEWDEPSVLEYEWGTDTEMPWRVRFELASDGDGGTVLTFDHLLPDAANPEFARPATEKSPGTSASDSRLVAFSSPFKSATRLLQFKRGQAHILD